MSIGGAVSAAWTFAGAALARMSKDVRRIKGRFEAKSAVRVASMLSGRTDTDAVEEFVERDIEGDVK